MPNKLNILIDTNSLFHLSELDFKEISKGKQSKIPASWLWDFCNVYICKTIMVEYERNLNKIDKNSDKTNAKETLRKMKKRGQKTFAKYTALIEKTIIGNYMPDENLSVSTDQGERHLICESIEMVYLNRLPNCIIVSDDYSAFKKFMEKAEGDYPFGNIWNVLDFVVYLYFVRREITHSQAQTAIKDLVALSSISAKKYKYQGNQTEIEARQAMLREYLVKLENIKQVRDLLPRKN
jgi:hypothetical protein